MDELLTLISADLVDDSGETPVNKSHFILCGDDPQEIGNHIATLYGNTNVRMTTIIRVDPSDQELLLLIENYIMNKGTLFEGTVTDAH